MKLFNSFFKTFQNKHNQKPNKASEKHDALIKAKMESITASPYYQHNLSLKEKVVGKVVSKSITGTSGFALFFSDGDWVATYLQEMKLTWEMGNGEFREDLETLMNSREYGNGYDPLSVDRPYANQVCDLGAEIANSHGKEIATLSFGERSFNFCFPDGMELDTTIVPTIDKKYALRVFWEQW